MAERLRIPGPRDVRATLDAPDAETVVVACPPHPQMAGDRRDARLCAVSDALAARGVACLRFDYGPWDEGRGEQTDAERAMAWAQENFESAALFGYSFGGAVALLVARTVIEEGTPPAAVSALAPAATLAGDAVADALDAIPCPLQVVVGERDGTVDAAPVEQRARELGHTVETLPADHFFVGQHDRVAELVAGFLQTPL